MGMIVRHTIVCYDRSETNSNGIGTANNVMTAKCQMLKGATNGGTETDHRSVVWNGEQGQSGHAENRYRRFLFFTYTYVSITYF